MLDPTKLANVRHIVTHADCADGIASAILLKDVLSLAEVHFLKHGTTAYETLRPWPEQTLFCDIVPPASSGAAFVEAGALVLDHHRTAKSVVEAFGKDGVFGDETMAKGVSGAVLAYQHVWQPLMDMFHQMAKSASQDDGRDADSLFAGQSSRAKNFATLIGIRDTWQNHDLRWREARALTEVLLFYPAESWLQIEEPFSQERQSFWEERRKVGETLLAKNDERVRKAIDRGFRFTTKRGTRVIVFEGLSETTSDAAEVLDQEVDLLIGYSTFIENDQAKMAFSTRSHTHFDCAAFCKAHGGGGHTKAAGFTALLKLSDFFPSPNPFNFAKDTVSAYELDL